MASRSIVPYSTSWPGQSSSKSPVSSDVALPSPSPPQSTKYLKKLTVLQMYDVDTLSKALQTRARFRSDAKSDWE